MKIPCFTEEEVEELRECVKRCLKADVDSIKMSAALDKQFGPCDSEQEHKKSIRIRIKHLRSILRKTK